MIKGHPDEDGSLKIRLQHPAKVFLERRGGFSGLLSGNALIMNLFYQA
jgi:hypothetical protein